MESVKNSRRKAFYLLMSVLVALAIWLYADLTSGPNGTARLCFREITDIPVEYTDVATLTDRGLMLVDEGSDLTVNLKLRGTRWMVSALDKSEIRFVVSLVDVTTPGVQNINYRMTFTDKRFNGEISLYEASIGNNATVNISELYRRNIDVKCDLVGSVAEPYSAGQVQLSHTEIEVRGLQGDIDPISYAKVTLDIGEGAEETVTKDLEIQFYDQDGELMEKDGIHPITDTIQATLPVSVSKKLNLEVSFEEMPGAKIGSTEYVIEPSVIWVSGDASTLKNVDTLNLGEFKLQNLGTTASANYTTTYYPIILPEGCQNLSGVTQAALRIRFKDMETATIPVSDIVLDNKPSDKYAELLTLELPVQIYGTAADVASVTSAQISARADLSDYASASGTYTVPVEVSVRSKDVGIIGTYEIKVNIREDVPEEPSEEPSDTPEE